MIISGYNVDLIRNVSGYKYVEKMNWNERTELRDKIISAAGAVEVPLKYIPSYRNMQDEINFIQEMNLLSMNITEETDPSILYNEEENIFIIINDVDHILMSAKADSWDTAYQKLKPIEKNLSSNFTFQKDRNFGYLTATTPLCGNGLVFDVLLHLPAMMNKNRILTLIKKIMKMPGAMLLPFNSGSRPSAFFVLRMISKGNIEKELNFMKNIAEEFCIMETAEREDLKGDEEFISYIKDRIDKYKAMEAVSFVDFLRVVDDITIYKEAIGERIEAEKINSLLVNTQPEHLKTKGIMNEELEKYYYKKIFELL